MDINPENLNCLQYRLIQVVSEYGEINAAEAEFQFQVKGRKTTPIAKIPLLFPVCDVTIQKGLLI